jgi:hypothetical protein
MGKDNARDPGNSELRAGFCEKLLLFLSGRGGGLCSLGLHQPLLEFVHATGRIHELLLARVERMTGVANADDDHGPGGAGLDHAAARATDLRVHILRMYLFFH